MNINASTTLAATDLGTTPLAYGVKLVIITYSGAWNNTPFSGKANSSLVTIGANTYTINYTDTYAGLNAVTLTSNGGGDPFPAWAVAHGLNPLTNGAKGADPDGDGVNNLLEFATDSDPTSGASGPRVYPLMHQIGTDTALTFTTAVRKNAIFAPDVSDSNHQTAIKDSIIYTIEGSDAMGNWSAVSVSEVIGADATSVQSALGSKLTAPPLDADWEWHTFRIDGSTAVFSKDYIRLKVDSTTP